MSRHRLVWFSLVLSMIVPAAEGGTVTEIIDATGDGLVALDTPWGIAADGVGNVYVTGFASDNVFKITATGQILEILDAQGDGLGNTLEAPIGVAVDGDGRAYVAGWGSSNVFEIAPDGAVRTILTEDSGLNRARAITVGESGTVYVSGDFSNSVFSIAPNGQIDLIINAVGDGTNKLIGPRGIAVDSAENVYVSGWGSDNVFMVEADGPVTQIIDASTEGFSGPHGLALDGRGNLYIGTLLAIFRRTPAGELSVIYDQFESLGVPLAIAAERLGNVYFGGIGNGAAYELRPSGAIRQILGGGAGGSINLPYAIAIGGDENIYVAGFSSDNAFRIQLPDFHDGFESGDTSGWTSMNP